MNFARYDNAYPSTINNNQQPPTTTNNNQQPTTNNQQPINATYLLKRIFSKYDIFELPYEITDKENIEELFAEMLVVVESKSRKNSSSRAFVTSYEKLNLEPVQQLNYSQSKE